MRPLGKLLPKTKISISYDEHCKSSIWDLLRLYLSDKPPIQRFPVEGTRLSSLPWLPHNSVLPHAVKMRRGGGVWFERCSTANWYLSTAGWWDGWGSTHARTHLRKPEECTDLTQLRTCLRFHRTIEKERKFVETCNQR